MVEHTHLILPKVRGSSALDGRNGQGSLHKTFDLNGTSALMTCCLIAGQVDAGAMWIHEGTPENPLYALAEKQGEPLSRLQNYFSGVLFSVDGERLQPADFLTARVSLSRFQTKIDQYKQAAAENPSINDTSIYNLYEEFLRESDVSPEEIPANNILAHVNYQALLNGNLTDLSTLRYGDAKTLPALDVFLYNGFDSLVKNMLPGLDVRYENPVARISQNEEGVVVTTESGDVYTGQYAISTQSLGCLKSGFVEYEPALPEAKLEAIDQMGMGVFDKAILVFDDTYWDERDFILREMNTLSGLWRVFLDYSSVLQKTALVAINVADTARELEKQSDDEIKQGLLTSLRQMYPDLPDPIEFYATRWAEDPWSLGSYSYYAVGNEKNITKTIGAPFNRVLFAGEAASDKPGTVLGAYLSGMREAERVSKAI